MKNLNKCEKNTKRHSLFFGGELDCLFLFRKEFLRTHLSVFENSTEYIPSILIHGPIACGKSLLAYQIWKLRRNSQRPFIKQDSSSLQKSSELQMAFKKAQGGDLLLKGIHELPLSMYENLKTFMLLHPNVRVIATSSESSQTETIKECFVKTITVAPLNERPEDIRHIVNQFLSRRGGMTCTPQAMEFLLHQKWKEEYEELLECVLKSIWFACLENRFHINREDVARSLSVNHIPFWNHEVFVSPMVKTNLENKGLKNFLRSIEAMILAKGLAETGGNISQLARYLQIPINTLINRCRNLQKEIENIQEIIYSS